MIRTTIHLPELEHYDAPLTCCEKKSAMQSMALGRISQKRIHQSTLTT